MNAAWESLLGATLALTTSGPIKQRVISSFSDHLENLDAAALPRDARVAFRDLVQRLTAARPMRGDTAVAATVRKMSNQEAEACAEAIVRLMSLCRPVQPVASDLPASVVPLYAASLPDNLPPLLTVSRA